jgi:3-oxoacyl-[acyl-carrier-protein] synthase II
MPISRRVVITGIGLVSPLGNSVKESWNALVNGKSGISRITRFNVDDFPVKIAGEVKNFNIENFIPAKEARHMDTFIHYGIAAGVEAFNDSGIDLTEEEQNKVGVLVGSGIGGLPMIENTHAVITEKGPRRVSPFFVPGSIINMISGHLSIKFNLKGPNLAAVTACTTGLHSIGLAARLIQAGDANAMLAGGSESTISPLGVGGFAAARALSLQNDKPELASRPFDINRNGFVLGEGAGVVFLESLESAKKRKAKIYAELVGFGMTGDAFHMTAPNFEGPKLCMQNALLNAEVNPDEVDYINAHGTSTLLGDKNETLAIKHCFRDSAYKTLISSTKSMTGHLLGGAGGVETVFTILSVFNDIVPPTINLNDPDPDCDLDYCPNEARQKKVKIALKNNFGFGGTNGSLVIKKLVSETP